MRSAGSDQVHIRGDPRQRPGFERRPQFRIMLVCGVMGVVLAGLGLFVGCAVNTNPSIQPPTLPGLPTLPSLPAPSGENPLPSLPPGFPQLPSLPPGFPGLPTPP
jgi:hypothetical protein